jgi:hypothetical protein
MIVRQDGDDLILIAQTDHSRLVGQFAAHWGNDAFAKPAPFESMARAAAFHDYGWLRYETVPMLGENGETPGFRQIPLTPDQLSAFQWCIDWLTGIDPYAGLIVGMHRTGLWRGRYGAVTTPPATAARAMTPMLETFIGENEARQAAGRRNFGEDQVWTNYHLMQIWDLLGLYFSCQDPYPDVIAPVPQGYGAARTDGVHMTLTPVDLTTVAFDPFPFETDGCEVQLVRRRLPRTTYADEAAFRVAYFQARSELVTFRLVRP